MAAFLKGREENAYGRTGKYAVPTRVKFRYRNIAKKENISTSLCDRFGIHMYTLEFMEHEKRYQEKQQEKEDEIFSNVLNNPEKEMTDTAFKRVIQAETTAVIKAEYNENKATSNPYINIAYGILGAILAGTVLFLIERYRRKRNENYHNYQK